MVLFSGRDNEESSPCGEPPGYEERLEKLGVPAPIASHKPGRIIDTLEKIERLLPRWSKPRKGFLLSFKNRILVGTLLVLIGVVITIGITLQIAIFPSLKGDSAVITNLKTVHFLASLIIIVVSWLFIEWISKKITLPLLQLTERADQISREAGERIAVGSDEKVLEAGVSAEGVHGSPQGDEIFQLTSSFNRMLYYLKASEARLRESEAKYRFLFDNNPSPIFVMDADTMMILDVNARAEEEYQYSRREFLNMSFSDLGLARDREQTSSRLKQIFPTEVAFLPVLKHRRKSGSLFMVSFQLRLTTYRDQPAIIASVWDVTERLEKHAMLIQTSKMATLGEMATGIAHELNQPLNVIRLGCDYLKKRMKSETRPTDEDLNQVTKELGTNVERASRIINHLRQFGRKTEQTRAPIDINKPIRETFTMLGTQFEMHSIGWQLDLAEDLPRILGDENQLEQVFINLVINARDAILGETKTNEAKGKPREKSVEIKSFVENGLVVVTISDTGPGIPESVVDRVFEPFFTTKKPGEGTGLGLSISYGIIKEHNGTIEINLGREKGTTFRLTFPALTGGDRK